MRTISEAAVAVAVASVAIFAVVPAWAQDYPTAPVKIISGFSAGKQAKILIDHHVQGHLASASCYPGRNRATERRNWLTNVYLLSSVQLRGYCNVSVAHNGLRLPVILSASGMNNHYAIPSGRIHGWALG